MPRLVHLDPPCAPWHSGKCVSLSPGAVVLARLLGGLFWGAFLGSGVYSVLCSCRVAFAWARILSIVLFMSLRMVSRGACLGGVRYVYWGGVSGASLGPVMTRPQRCSRGWWLAHTPPTSTWSRWSLPGGGLLPGHRRWRFWGRSLCGLSGAFGCGVGVI